MLLENRIHRLAVEAMRVPAALAAADEGVEIDVDEANPRFDQPAREQTTLTVSRSAVAVAHRRGLRTNVKRLLHARRGQHGQGAFVLLVDALGLRRELQELRLLVDEPQHLSAIAEPLRG